jgi:hypothetical protein
LKTHFNIILPSTSLAPPGALFPSCFPIRTVYEPLPPYVLHLQPIIFFLIRSSGYFLARRTDHELSHCASCVKHSENQKCKVVPVHATRANKGSRDIAPPIPNLGA